MTPEMTFIETEIALIAPHPYLFGEKPNKPVLRRNVPLVVTPELIEGIFLRKMLFDGFPCLVISFDQTRNFLTLQGFMGSTPTTKRLDRQDVQKLLRRGWIVDEGNARYHNFP